MSHSFEAVKDQAALMVLRSGGPAPRYTRVCDTGAGGAEHGYRVEENRRLAASISRDYCREMEVLRIMESPDSLVRCRQACYTFV